MELSYSGKTEILRKGDMPWQEDKTPAFICPEFREQVADGVVYLRASCQRMTCTKWRAGTCRECSTTGSCLTTKQQRDLLEGRS